MRFYFFFCCFHVDTLNNPHSSYFRVKFYFVVLIKKVFKLHLSTLEQSKRKYSVKWRHVIFH